MVSRQIRVLLADDHEMFREALALALSQIIDLQVVAVAVDGREAVQRAKEVKPNVAILDVFMPNLNGLEAFRQMRVEDPKVAGVLISGFHWDSHLVEGVRAGLHGFVPKAVPLSELIEAVRVVVKGGVYVSPYLSVPVLDLFNTAQLGEQEFTPRECEVLQLIAEGLTTKEIAQRLSVSVKTADHHRERVMRRSGIHSVAGLTRYAIRKGLVPP